MSLEEFESHSSMAQSIDIRDTNVVVSSPKWRPFTMNVAIATGVTSNGRTVQGIGEARWSEDGALDAAVANLKENARETDFSFTISTMVGGDANVRVEFLEEQGIIRTTNANRGMTKRRSIEITASKDGRTVTTEDDIGMINLGVGRASWAETLSSAIESAQSQLDRVGKESLDD